MTNNNPAPRRAQQQHAPGTGAPESQPVVAPPPSPHVQPAAAEPVPGNVRLTDEPVAQADPVEPSQYDLAHLTQTDQAAALGSTPGEVRSALHGMGGLFSVEQVQAAIAAWRERPIPPR